MTSPQKDSKHLSHTPVTILTGFLGSGKTTLLNRALRDPSMANTAVVINEFGEVGLDHMLAARSDDTIMVLENGCLCCTVFGDLVTTLNNLYHAREANEIPRFDHVVIETSGLADPSPLIQAFLSDPTLAGLYRIGTVVATVDAVNGPGRSTITSSPCARSRWPIISSSPSAICWNRRMRKRPRRRWSRGCGGLIRPPRFRGSTIRPSMSVRCCAPRASIRPTPRPMRAPGSTPPPTSSKTTTITIIHHDHDHDDHDHHHLHDRDIASFCFVRETPISREALRLLLDALQQNLGPNLLRVKGIVNVAEEPGRPAVIQGAQHLLHNLSWLERWPDADHRSKIVFITQGFDRAEVEDMIALLDRVATRTAAARARAQSAQ